MIVTEAPAKYYNSIAVLSLAKFIDCCVEGDLQHLVISGEPSEEDLIAAWNQIQEQYASALGDAEVRLYWQLCREVAVLAVNYNLVANCVLILSHFYNAEIAKELNQILNTSFLFEPVSRHAELQRCLNRAKDLTIRHDIKSSQLNALAKKHGAEGAKPSREYFQSLLVSLSDHAKHEIPDTITVFSFCERIKRLNNYVQQAKSK